MKTKDLKAINDYAKAKAESESILQEAEIKQKYSYPVYKLCSILLPAVICLTHHQMLKQEEEINYNWIFTNLSGFLDDECTKKVVGLYENWLEYNFFLMGADVFESFDEYTIPDHEYCSLAMEDWYRFKKALIKDNGSPIYNELLVAITELSEYGYKIDESAHSVESVTETSSPFT